MKAYPAESYQRLYDSSLDSLWSVEQGLSPAEDGDHAPLPPGAAPEFFEWWYFDAAFDNGYRLVVIFHSALFNAAGRPPAVDIRITPPSAGQTQPQGSQVNFQFYAREQYRGARQRCQVAIGACSVEAETPQRYVLHLQQGDLTADLVFTSDAAPSWKPGTGYLFFDAESGHYFKWVVPQPVARVTGYLSLGQAVQPPLQRMAVTGLGYHDHNWGNFHLAQAFDYWLWGRFISQDGRYGLVFGDVVGAGPQPEHVRPVLLIADGKTLPAPPRLAFDYQDWVSDPLTKAFYPQALTLRTDGAAERQTESAASASPTPVPMPVGAGVTALLDTDLSLDFSLVVERKLEALNFARPPSFGWRLAAIERILRQAIEILFYLTYTRPLIGPFARRVLGCAAYLRLAAQAKLALNWAQASRQTTGSAIYEAMFFRFVPGKKRRS